MQPRNSAAPGFMSQQEWFCCKHQFSAPQIRYRFLRSRPPRRGPRCLPVGALVSSRRFAGAICSFAVAIQLSMRFILLGRAKARWFLERGFPGSVFPRRVGALRHADARSACLRGMRRTSICESVRFRSAYNSSWLSLRESCRRRRLRGSAACYPLRPRCARPPLPKGEARSRLLPGFPFSLFLPHFFFVRSLLLPLFQYILFPLAFIFLLEEHGLFQRWMEALDGKLL